MKKFFVYSLLLVAFMSSSFTGTSQTADEVIDKYVAAIGGKENWKKINSIRMEGNVEVQGLEIRNCGRKPNIIYQ